MTEIRVEKKTNTVAWVMLILGIIALALYLFVFKKDNSDMQVINETPVSEVRENDATVLAFTSFARSDTNAMSLDHAYTNAALLKLTDATSAMASATGYDVKADLDKAKEYAGKITEDPFETTHADNIRKSAELLSTALQNLQTAKYPGLSAEAMEVSRAAAGINPDVLTLDQRSQVKNFFISAANLLEKMN